MVGSFEVIGLLGAGGMGEVYRAGDTKLNREVALKMLPSEFALDADAWRASSARLKFWPLSIIRTSAPSTASRTQMACRRSCCSWWKVRRLPIELGKVRSHCAQLYRETDVCQLRTSNAD
jgi:serine/threonine protein kinase